MSYFVDPWSELRRIQRQMDNMFTDTLKLESGNNSSSSSGQLSKDQNRSWRPKVDVTETGDNYVIHAELPGVKKEDVSIEFHNNLITISGKRTYEKREDKETYHQSERVFGKFTRSLPLPKGVNHEDIQAKYDNGVLEINIPKPKEQQPQKIAISSTTQSE